MSLTCTVPSTDPSVVQMPNWLPMKTVPATSVRPTPPNGSSWEPQRPGGGPVADHDGAATLDEEQPTPNGQDGSWNIWVLVATVGERGHPVGALGGPIAGDEAKAIIRVACEEEGRAVDVGHLRQGGA